MSLRAAALLAVAGAGATLAACRAPAPEPTPAPAPPPVVVVPGATVAGTLPGGAPNGTPIGTPAAIPILTGPGVLTGGDPQPRPYGLVITPDTRSRRGLFTTHRVRARLLYEIPPRELAKDMLLVASVARSAIGQGTPGATGQRVLRWERRDHRVLLRSVRYDIIADTAQAVYRAVEAANVNPIVAAFNVEAYGPDSAPVIDVTRLFLSPPTELTSAGGGFATPFGGAPRGAPDPSRSFLESVATFPRNVEVEATLTYGAGGGPLVLSPGAPGGVTAGPALASSVVMHWSMVKLPERPMTPRLRDDRVGYFAVQQIDFGRPEQRATRRSYITRHRLECSDRRVAGPRGDSLCVPVQPIAYYVDAATPAQWRPWIKRGIEAWKPAFEAAGFADAIVALDPPSPRDDPDWSPEDARYSVVRWLTSTIPNAAGPHVHDPRSGEILEADVELHHNVQTILRTQYWTQVAPLDPRARRLPLPDSLMGRLLEYVVAHEIGHTLGLPHNLKASATYPVDSLRDRGFVRRMGHVPTLMDYARFNYVAQPQDSIPPSDLVPGVGPYDKFAISWGYRPIDGALTPDDERPTLDRWARVQDTAQYLRFSSADGMGIDPGENVEAVGDGDPVKAARWGLRNLERAMPLLEPATAREGESYADTREMYEALVEQWVMELRPVVALVGGAESRELYVGQEGPRFVPVPRARQREAVRFLQQEAFGTPVFMLDGELLRKLEPRGAIDRVNRAQSRLLVQLLEDARLARLAEYEATAPKRASTYALADFLADLQRGLFAEAYEGRSVDAYRRALQRTYLEQVATKLGRASAPPSGFTIFIGDSPRAGDARALLRSQLRDLRRVTAAAAARTSDRVTRAHFEDVRDRVTEVLEPRR